MTKMPEQLVAMTPTGASQSADQGQDRLANLPCPLSPLPALPHISPLTLIGDGAGQPTLHALPPPPSRPGPYQPPSRRAGWTLPVHEFLHLASSKDKIRKLIADIEVRRKEKKNVIKSWVSLRILF